MSEREPRTKPPRLALAVLLGSLAVAAADAAPADHVASIRDQIQASFTPGAVIESDGPPDDIVVC